MSTQPASTGLIPEWTFGDRIRKIRRQLGMTQGQFAASIERGPKSVAAWELGTNAPSDAVAVAKRIQVAHGIPASWTLGLDDERPRPVDPDGGGSEECAIRDSNPEPAGMKHSPHLRLATAA